MGGVVEINDKDTWMVAGWAHDSVLRKTSTKLPETEHALRALMLDNCTDVSVGYCDLSALSAAEFLLLKKAFNDVYDEAIVAGPQSFHDPKFYPGYISGFKQLIDMLENDPRSKGNKIT